MSALAWVVLEPRVLDRDFWAAMAEGVGVKLWVSRDGARWSRLEELPDGTSEIARSSTGADAVRVHRRTMTSPRLPWNEDETCAALVGLVVLELGPLRSERHDALPFAAREAGGGVMRHESMDGYVGRTGDPHATLDEALAGLAVSAEEDDDPEVPVPWESFADAASFTLVLRVERPFTPGALVALVARVGGEHRELVLERVRTNAKTFSGFALREDNGLVVVDFDGGPSRRGGTYYLRMQCYEQTATETGEVATMVGGYTVDFAKEVLAALAELSGAYVIEVETSRDRSGGP